MTLNPGETGIVRVQGIGWSIELGEPRHGPWRTGIAYRRTGVRAPAVSYEALERCRKDRPSMVESNGSVAGVPARKLRARVLTNFPPKVGVSYDGTVTNSRV